MRVCFIITGLTMGGAERQVVDLSDELSNIGHSVKIISLTGDVIVKPKSNSVEIISLKTKKNIVSYLHAIIKARKIIKAFKPDVVHSHMIHANIFSRIMRLFIYIPKLICTAHSNNEGGKMRMLAYRFTDKLSDITTNVSDDAVDIYIKNKAAPRNKIITVSNGLDVRNFSFSGEHRQEKRKLLSIDNDCYLYLAVGRLCDAKDYPNLLNAFSLLLRSTEEKIFLAIIGDGIERENIEKLIYSLNITEHVKLLGLQKDVNKWLSAADSYVLSSNYEGFGLALAEAMLTERFVIATDCGGVKDVINGYGLLVPVSNHKLLAEAMSKSLHISKNERMNIGYNARKYIVNKFSFSIIINNWIYLYNKK